MERSREYQTFDDNKSIQQRREDGYLTTGCSEEQWRSTNSGEQYIPYWITKSRNSEGKKTKREEMAGRSRGADEKKIAEEK